MDYEEEDRMRRELDRREDYDRQSRRAYDRPDDDEDVAEFFVKFFFFGGLILFLVIGGMYLGAGWLDAQFGFGLVDWLNSWLPEWLQRGG